MQRKGSVRQLVVLVAFSAPFISTGAVADDRDNMAPGLGVGVTARTTSGERIDTTRRQGVTLDYDYEDSGGFGFLGGSYLAGDGHGNDWDIRFGAGMGWRFAKMGIAMLSRGGEYQAAQGVGNVGYRATGFAFYTRLHPLDTRYLTATVDGYAGHYTTGKTSSCNCGGVVYESVDAGDGYGYSARILMKLTSLIPGALSLNYTVDRIDFDAGALGGVTAATRIMSRQAAIQYHWQVR